MTAPSERSHEAVAAPAERGSSAPASGGRLRKFAAHPATAAWAFALYVAGGGLYYLVVQIPGRWFHADEWQALTAIGSGTIADLLDDHYQHWITLPLLVYRLLFQVFGLNSYAPYAAVALGFHLAVVVMVRVVMRRSGVAPWTATIFAAVLVLFGPGDQNILWGYQITMTGALLFGLVHLVLADRPGRRILPADWLGLFAGLLALMFSGVGLLMVGVVGAAVLIRRSWRPAAFHTLPLLVVFIVWWLSVEPDSSDIVLRPALTDLPRWLVTAWGSAFEALGYFWIVGLVLAAATVVGLVVCWRGEKWDVFRHHAAMPLAMAAGFLVFPVMIFPSRAGLGPEFAGSSRYIYVYCVLLLPLVAFSVNALVARRRAALVLLCIPLVVLPLNATVHSFFPASAFAHQRLVMRGVAASPSLQTAPADLIPDPPYWMGNPQVTVGWLRQAVADGRFDPQAQSIPPVILAEAELRLALSQTFSPPGVRPCPDSASEVERVRLEPGQTLTFESGTASAIGGLESIVVVQVRPIPDPMGFVLRYTTSEGDRITNVSESSLRLSLTTSDREPWRLCR